MDLSKQKWQSELVLPVIVHSFNMGDVEDPDLFAAYPLIEFEKSEKGKWVLENSVEQPVWSRLIDSNNFGYKYNITAFLTEKNYIIYQLRYT